MLSWIVMYFVMFSVFILNLHQLLCFLWVFSELRICINWLFKEVLVNVRLILQRQLLNSRFHKVCFVRFTSSEFQKCTSSHWSLISAFIKISGSTLFSCSIPLHLHRININFWPIVSYFRRNYMVKSLLSGCYFSLIFLCGSIAYYLWHHIRRKLIALRGHH